MWLTELLGCFSQVCGSQGGFDEPGLHRFQLNLLMLMSAGGGSAGGRGGLASLE